MSAIAYLRPELPKAALHGFAGVVAVTLAQATGADPAAVLLQFLAMLGNCVGPEPHVWFRGARHPARLFVLLVGDAAHGLKGTSLGALLPLFAEADPDWRSHRLQSGIQSPEAMVELVADGPEGDCRLLMVETEYQRLVSRSAASGTFSPHLCNGFDGTQLQVTRRKRGPNDTGSSLRSSNPHISLIGHITPEEFARMRSIMRRAGGLETRLIHAIVHRQSNVNPLAQPSIDLGALAGRLHQTVEWSRGRVLEHTDPISRELCIERGVQPSFAYMLDPTIASHWDDIETRMPTVHVDYQHLLHRGPVQVVRFACGYAIADMAPQVSMEHIEAGLALWEFCAKSTERLYSIPTGDLTPEVDPKRRGQLVEYLAKSGEWVSREDISNAVFSRNVPAVDIDAVVQSLVHEGLVEERKVPTAGRPRVEYRLIPPASTP